MKTKVAQNSQSGDIPKTVSDRVRTLRNELQRRELTGFLIPHADEYQNEYLPACAERLSWLTGFTGSAGTAVVLQDRAGIFVDGRYVLQVRKQVDSEVFEPHHSTEEPVTEWLESILKIGHTLGYDPWLHSQHEIRQFQKACEKVGAKLVACDTNPLDTVWTDRPLPPLNPVVPHDVQYAGASSKEKREQLTERLLTAGVDVAVISAPDSIAWLLNIRGNDVEHTPLPLSFALLHGDGTVRLFVDDRKMTPELQDHLGSTVSIYSPDAFGGALDQLGREHKRVQYDPKRSASWIGKRLSDAGATIVEDDDPCILPKACKNPVEVAGAREAHQRDGVAVCQFLAWLVREGLDGQVTELDAQDFLDARREAQAGWRDLSFPTISAAGPHGAIVHYRASEATNGRIESGTLYLVDSGGQYVDGTTDITRTMAIGTPKAEYRDRYTRVLKGHIALGTAKFPKGTTGSQLDILARRPLWEAGLDYDHGTGHGVGSYLGVHEGPQRISKVASSVALEPGMIVSNEPGFYQAGEYGIRIENLIVVVPGKKNYGSDREFLAFETLTLVPYDRLLIDADLLTIKEREWVNAYHARVRETLMPLVDPDTASWLDMATVPLV